MSPDRCENPRAGRCPCAATSSRTIVARSSRGPRTSSRVRWPRSADTPPASRPRRTHTNPPAAGAAPPASAIAVADVCSRPAAAASAIATAPGAGPCSFCPMSTWETTNAPPAVFLQSVPATFARRSKPSRSPAKTPAAATIAIPPPANAKRTAPAAISRWRLSGRDDTMPGTDAACGPCDFCPDASGDDEPWAPPCSGVLW
jgi:hypothetical protein